MEKILFATSYGHESIIKTILENKPFKELVLFEDDEEKDKQKSSLKYIESITKLENIKTTRIKIPLYDIDYIIKKLDSELKKHKKKQLYFDISHGPRSQALSIVLYLMLKYPINTKKITSFNQNDNELIEYPLFQIKELSQKEFETLQYINKNKMFFQKDLAVKLKISTAHTSRILDKLLFDRFITKENSNWLLTHKGKIYILVKNK